MLVKDLAFISQMYVLFGKLPLELRLRLFLPSSRYSQGLAPNLVVASLSESGTRYSRTF